MDKLSQFLSGKKTHLAGGGLVVLGGAVLFGAVHLTPEQMAGAMALLMGVGKIFLRVAVEKLGEKAVAQ